MTRQEMKERREYWYERYLALKDTLSSKVIAQRLGITPTTLYGIVGEKRKEQNELK